MASRAAGITAWSDEASVELGRRIRARRRELRLSQDRLASTAGLSRNVVQALEQGRAANSCSPANPTITTLCAIGAALEIGPDELLRGLS